MRAVAADLGLRFVESGADRAFTTSVPEGLPTSLPLLRSADPSRDVRDLCFGEFAGLPVQLFEYHEVTFRTDPANAHRSCLALRVDALLPELAVCPHNKLSASSRRPADPTGFNDRFRVITRDTTGAAALLDEGNRRWFVSLPGDPSLEMAGHRLLLHLAPTDPGALPELLTSLYLFTLRIPDSFGG